jgi:thiosulfate/3-mercaptopyruvate sulfurtransferase
MFTTLIDPSTLAAHLADVSWVVLDARFDLADPGKGRAAYEVGHIPGARYVDLDRDLSAEKTGRNGRHPLPAPEVAAARFGALGIGAGTQVVVYDADTGMYAARAWWMLRWIGHDAVAVLDGGLARWVAEGRPVATDVPGWAPATLTPRVRDGWRLTADEVAAQLGRPDVRLVDARAKERYMGQNETIDKVAGHIPGARSCFFGQNLTEAKTFKSPAALRAQWAPIVGDDPSRVVMYCGSGVTACHNLLALEVAGLPGARIFPGSWSEWSQDPSRPVATGDES